MTSEHNDNTDATLNFLGMDGVLILTSVNLVSIE